MARDHWVYWKGTSPTKMQIEHALCVYVNGLSERVRWDEEGQRYFVDLIGTTTTPFWPRPGRKPENRYFEVYVCVENIDVITREMDEITNVIAKGFAEFAATYWKGELVL